MANSNSPDGHRKKQFHIECPVTLEVRGHGKRAKREQGLLQDIGVNGARLYLDHALEEGTRVVLRVHFPSPTKGVSTVRFEGTVMKSAREPRYEVAIQFQRAGRFLRDGLARASQDRE